jgi:hypothetical protein
MAFIGNFNAEEVKPAGDFSALPAGDYAVIISNSEMKPTKTGGQMLVLTLQVIEGEHKDRYLWSRLNLQNANEKAVEIAQRELSAICHATGVMRLSDSAELHDKPMTVKVAYVPPKGEYGESNDIKAWRPYGSKSVTPAPAAQAVARAAPRSAPPAAQAPTPKTSPPKAPPPAAVTSSKPWLNPKTAPVADDVAAEDIPF